MKKMVLLVAVSLILAGCGGSMYGRSGPGGSVGGSKPVVVWAAPPSR